jgi:hypothetical protein
MMLLRLVATVTGVKTEFDGLYVKRYDPSYHPPGEAYDGGLLEVTPDPAEALTFPTGSAAIMLWQLAHGTRPDGTPDRPLTAWTIEVVPLEEAVCQP